MFTDQEKEYIIKEMIKKNRKLEKRLKQLKRKIDESLKEEKEKNKFLNGTIDLENSDFKINFVNDETDIISICPSCKELPEITKTDDNLFLLNHHCEKILFPRIKGEKALVLCEWEKFAGPSTLNDGVEIAGGAWY